MNITIDRAMNANTILPIFTAAALLVGCATGNHSSSREAEETLSRQTGLPVRWNRSSADAAAIQEQIRPLLQRELTADSALQIALVNNPALQAELEEIGIAQADLVQAGLPKNIELAASWRIPEDAGVVNAEYGIAGDFLDLILIPLRKKVARQNLESATSRVSYEVLSLAAEVKTAFYITQAHQQLLNRLQQIVEVNAAAMDFARRQHEAGNISDLQWLNQQNAYTQSRLALAETQRELRRSRENLNRLLGLWGKDTNWKIADALPPLPKSESDLRHLETAAIEQRHDLAAARQNLNSVGYSLAWREKTRYTPVSVNIGVDAERETDRSWVIGPTLDLELPIFDRGQGAIPRLQSQYRQALWQLEEIAVNARSEVREKRDELIAARDLAEYYDKVLLPQRKRLVGETLLQYNAMQLGSFDLLSARERELETAREHIQALRDYWITRAELERALGGRLPPPTSVPHSAAAHTENKPAAPLPAKKDSSSPQTHDRNHH